MAYVGQQPKSKSFDVYDINETNENFAYTINTVEEFTTVPSTADTVIVKDKDRGGVFNKISTTTANDGTIFNGTGCSWERQYSGAVNVKWFGAKGDGITDDTVAIQSAIDLGVNTYISSGTYRCVSTIFLNNAGCHIYGDDASTGDNLSVLRLDSSVLELPLLKAVTTTGFVKFSSIQLNGTSRSNGLLQVGFETIADGTSNTGNILFENCFFTNWSRAGAHLRDQWFINFKNCYFVGCSPSAVDGIPVPNTGGIVFSPAGNLPGWSGSGNEINSCYFSSGSYGIYASAPWNTTLINCIFEHLDTPYHKGASGVAWTEIGCWYEDNTNPPVNGRGGFLVAGRGREVVYPNADFVSTEVSENGNFNVRTSKLDIITTGSKGVTCIAGEQDGSASSNGILSIIGGGLSFNGAKTLLAITSNAAVYPSRQLGLNLGDYNNISNVGKILFKASGGTASARVNIVFGTGYYTDSSNYSYADRWTIDYLGDFIPSGDNLYSIGSAGVRVEQIFAANGTINTSDDSEKTYFDILEVEKAVALELKQNMRKFKWNDSIEVKGDSARIHFGTSAQTVKAIFEKHGLVAEDYGLLCYDEWEDQYEEVVQQPILDSEGNVVKEEVTEQKLMVKAGNRYGIRYEELLCFIISAM
jgi:hypothetical protein